VVGIERVTKTKGIGREGQQEQLGIAVKHEQCNEPRQDIVADQKRINTNDSATYVR
jgi:hypothetical protein